MPTQRGRLGGRVTETSGARDTTSYASQAGDIPATIEGPISPPGHRPEPAH
jgi:hypothetical protein